jgi:hypothetical protein
MGRVHPPPFPEWQEILSATLEGIRRLPPTAQKDEIAQAVGPLSLLAHEFEDQVHQGRRLSVARPLMATLVDLPWSNFFAVVQTYFIVPMKRVLVQFKALDVAIEYRIELSEQHVKKDIEPFLEREYLSKWEAVATDPRLELAREKLQHFMEQWRVLVPFAQRIRPSAVPPRVLGYVKKVLWYGILATLLDSTAVSMGSQLAMASVSDPSAGKILEIMMVLLKKFNDEKLSFNEKEIKDMMAVREEMERTSVIKRFHKMTDEEKAVEKMNKVLGLGDWAVGGTKLIYAYDQDYYDQERVKREEAGIYDPTDVSSSHDEWGAPVVEEEGYDVNQHADDDNE